MKINLTTYSDQELSLNVYNTEWLYNERNEVRFVETLKDCFIFTNKQLESFLEDLEAEKND